MKKIIYFIVIIVSLSLAFASCTKEEVKPQTGDSVGGGASTKV